MALGATHWNFRADVRRKADALAANRDVTYNTYVDHPFPGWDRRSVDFWGPGGRGDPIARIDGRGIWTQLMRHRGEWGVRHIIFERRWWTNWAGELEWESDDHSGDLRHVHVTFL